MGDCGECDELCRDLSLLDGDKGNPGTAGRDGAFAANANKYVFNAGTVGNPGNTFLLFNNASVTAATSISVSNVEFNNNTITTWLASALTSNATLKAYIRVCKEFDSSQFAEYSLSAGVANAGYYTYTIAYLGGSGASPFVANDNVIFSYVITGNNGAAGASGSTILYNNCATVDSGDTGGVDVALKTFNIPVNTFVNNGDCVTIIAQNLCNDSQLPAGAANVDYETLTVVNNAVSGVFPASGVYASNFQFREFKVELNRVSSTSLRATYHVLDSNNQTSLYFLDMAGLDFTLVTAVTMFANTTVALASVSGYVKSIRLYVEYKAI